MRISAKVLNTESTHRAEVATAGQPRAIAIPAKAGARGSEASGGELLMLALATCYCNDLFREAARLGLVLRSVEVEAEADFPGVGLAATDIRYTARIESDLDPADIERLLAETDAVAEVHNTVRGGVPVVLRRG